MSTDFNKEKFDEILAENDKLTKINEMWRRKFQCERNHRLYAESVIDELANDIKSFQGESGQMKQELKKMHNDNKIMARMIDNHKKQLKALGGQLEIC